MKTFQDFQTDMFRLYQEKSYSKALSIVTEAAKEFPEKRARTAFWIACLQSRLGNLDQAVQTLREGIQHGVWWSEETLRDPDLDPVRSKPEFASILADCQHLKQKSAKIAKPELLVRSPTGPSKGRLWPVLVVCHQRYGDRPDQTAHEWSSILQNGVGLVVPWSSQVYAQDGRCWDNLDIAERDMLWVYSELKRHPGIDLDRLVLAGFSQGAALAVYLTLKRAFPCRGFIAVAPSDWVVPESKRATERDRPSPAFTSFIQASSGKGFRGQIFIGENDPFLKKIEFLKDEMVHRGLECEYSVEPKTGHEYPDNFDSKLAKSLRFVLRETRKGN
jgi:predicted esterase